MRISIESIIIRKRIRKNLGDLTGLINSLKKYGQLNPIVINRKNVLIAGNRRLEAARNLGWTSINAIVINKDNISDMLEIELEENIERTNLSNDEITEGFTKLDKLKNPGFFGKIKNFFIKIFRKLFKKKY